MRIIAKEPKTGKVFQMEAQKVPHSELAEWLVMLPGGISVVITFRNNRWESMAKDQISHDFARIIGHEINNPTIKEEL